MIIIFAFTQCKMPASEKNKDVSYSKNLPKLSEDKGISLINLIADPEKYNGRLIRVEGFLNIEFEGTAIYFHKEDCDLGICENAIWMDLSKADITSSRFQSLNKKYVLLEGTFESSNKGHFGRYNGTITKITRAVKLKIINK